MWQTIFQKKILIFLVIAFLIITWAIFMTSNPDRGGEIAPEWLVRTVIHPFQQLLGSTSKVLVESWQTLNRLGKLNRENQELQGQVKRLRMNNGRLIRLAQENRRLRQDLNFRTQAPLKLLSAEVIAWPPSNWTRTVTIDKGSKNGVKRNMAVITEDGVAGRILTVHPNNAEVLLINDGREGNSLSGVLERTRDLVYVYGAGPYCRVVPSDIGVTLRNGDRILTSESSLYYPKDLLVGVVVEVMRSGAGLKGEALLKPAVSSSRLESVFVVLNNIPKKIESSEPETSETDNSAPENLEPESSERGNP
ncbi:MAG TPA: rod shape-determining protein MreC [Bacillota bacterium]|nr:rod shape-determining protein MreC [Bacillota bacterium]